MISAYGSHKDRLFRKLFGDESNKDALLSLYNALNGTAYTDPSELTINTIEDVLYMSMKNDISCILDNQMVLMEHQSTFNPNMPLRGLIYFGKLYNQFIETNSLDLYSTALIKIPTPRYFILYNGVKEFEDRTLLRLSDAFVKEERSGNFEWTAEMININSGHNEEIMKSCQILDEYAYLIQLIRDNRKDGMDISAAVNCAVDQCIREKKLYHFLMKWKSEVIEMCITEYNEERTMQTFLNNGIALGRAEGRVEGKEEGRVEGRKEGRFDMLFQLVKQGLLSPEIAAENASVPLTVFLLMLEKHDQDPEAYNLFSTD